MKIYCYFIAFKNYIEIAKNSVFGDMCVLFRATCIGFFALFKLVNIYQMFITCVGLCYTWSDQSNPDPVHPLIEQERQACQTAQKVALYSLHGAGHGRGGWGDLTPHSEKEGYIKMATEFGWIFSHTDFGQPQRPSHCLECSGNILVHYKDYVLIAIFTCCTEVKS